VVSSEEPKSSASEPPSTEEAPVNQTKVIGTVNEATFVKTPAKTGLPVPNTSSQVRPTLNQQMSSDTYEVNII